MEIKPIKFKSLNGISEKQISEHHDVLYAGYVKKVNEIREKLKVANREEANATFSDFRALKVEETFALNAVKLHEGYFDNLGGDGKPSGKILKIIEEDFGSFEEWERDFKSCGMVARGWVVLAFDLTDKKIHNFVCDAHNLYGIWNCIPLLILDMYEHAYFIDFVTSKKKYIDIFMQNVDWKFVNNLMESHKIDEIRG
jgi:Fe-Mn family superoxide dismutase